MRLLSALCRYVPVCFSQILCLSDDFYLAEDPLWKILYREAAPCRLGCEILCVNSVESRKVRYISEEASSLDDFIETRCCSLKDRTDIFAALCSLCFDSFRNIACCRIYRDLSRCINESVRNNPCEYGPIAPGALSVATTFI